MVENISHFFETLAAATDQWFETLAQSIEETVTEVHSETLLALQEIEDYLLMELLESYDPDDPAGSQDWSLSLWHYPDLGWRQSSFSGYDSEPFPWGYIGDPSCRYNALSPELRCAVNPYGPCKGCKDYAPLES